MNSHISDLFNDQTLVAKIQKKLPKLFQMAEIEMSRQGKVGMEVGTLREQILTSLLIYKFGEKNIDTNIAITSPEVDVKLFDTPISIKTITGKNFTGIKLSWTVDAQRALQFRNTYQPSCDLLLTQINWDNGGGLFYIMKENQSELMQTLNDNYFVLPKPGTNPRGVEISGQAMQQLANNPQTLYIPINWRKEVANHTQFTRWLELWQED